MRQTRIALPANARYNQAPDKRRRCFEAKRAELPELKRQIQGIIEAIKNGLYQSFVKAEMARLEARKTDVEQATASADVSPPLLHPSLADVYRCKINALVDALARDDTKAEAEAAAIVRSLVSKIDLTPEDGRLAITLHGDLARMLSFAAATKKPGIPGWEAGLSAAIGSQVSVVAGGGFGQDYNLPAVLCCTLVAEACNQRYLRLSQTALPC